VLGGYQPSDDAVATIVGVKASIQKKETAHFFGVLLPNCQLRAVAWDDCSLLESLSTSDFVLHPCQVRKHQTLL